METLTFHIGFSVSIIHPLMALSARLIILALIAIAVSSFASGAFAEETAVNLSEYDASIARLERFLSESTSTKTNTTVSTTKSSSEDKKEDDSEDDKEKEESSEDDKEKEESSNDDKKKEESSEDDKKKEESTEDDKKKEDKEKEDESDDDKEKEDDSDDDKEKEDDSDDDKEKEDDSDDDKEDSKNPKVKGDPHFTGADSSHFDFSGTPNKTYCLISDSHLHLNAYFGGYYGKYEGNPSKALTWIRKVGLLWGHHSVLFEARAGASWQYGSGYMSRIEVDGDEVVLSQAGDKASFADGAAVIAWEEAKLKSGDDEIDVFSLDIAGVMKLILELRPEVPNLRTETDGTVHFDLQVTKSRLSSNAHGVLGQTFRPDHANRLTKQKLVFSKLLNAKVVPGDNAEGFLDGTVEDYKSSALLSPDCKVSRFARAQQLDEETALAIELSGKVKAVGTSGLPRKMLSVGAF